MRLCQEYGGLDSLSMPDVLDLVEQSRDILDDVWRQTDFDPYPETRMVRLMDVIGRKTDILASVEKCNAVLLAASQYTQTLFVNN